MPTTLTLDDELSGLLRVEAQHKGKPVTEVAVSLLRMALVKPVAGTSTTAATFRIQPHRGVFAPGVNLKKLNRLADDLDTDSFLAK